MSRAAAETGIGPTALVAVEQYYPAGERVITDDLASKMLPLGSKIFVRMMKPRWVREWIIGLSEKSQPGIWGGLLCRKRYINEKLVDAARSMEAVVNLGAGFDTRDFRLPSVVPVWEVDQPVNIKSKEVRLRKALGTIPANVNLVSVDFDHEDPAVVLASRGYSPDLRTFYVMEAVTQYLTEGGLRETFAFLSKSKRGSRLVFTYVRKDFLDGREMYGWESGYKRFVKSGIWLSAMNPDEVPRFLDRYGWKLIEDKGYDELAEEYLNPFGRRMKSTPLERMVYSEKL